MDSAQRAQLAFLSFAQRRLVRPPLAHVMAPSEKRQHGKRNRDDRDHVPSYHASAALEQRLARIVERGKVADDLAAEVDGHEAAAVQLDQTNHDAVWRNNRPAIQAATFRRDVALSTSRPAHEQGRNRGRLGRADPTLRLNPPAWLPRP